MKRVRLPISALALALVLPTRAADADTKRTPELRWTLDAQLNVSSSAAPGVVVQGDKVVVSVDTTQRFGGTGTAIESGSPFFAVVERKREVKLTAIAHATNVATFTTDAAHGLSPGAEVTIAGSAVPAYNARFEVATVPSATTFTVPLVSANLAAGSSTVTVPLVPA